MGPEPPTRYPGPFQLPWGDAVAWGSTFPSVTTTITTGFYMGALSLRAPWGT